MIDFFLYLMIGVSLIVFGGIAAFLILVIIEGIRERRTLRIIAAKRLPLFAMALLLLPGCAYVRAYDHERQAGFSSMMPAWPWQDSMAIIEKMNISSGTNKFTASIRGLNEQEVTSTNAAAMIEAVSKGAIEGAIKALKP